MAGKITDLTSIPAIDRAVDVLEIVDVSANASYSVTPNSLMGISSVPLGTSDVQSPTNKTFDNTNSLTVKDTNLTVQDDGDTTKQLKFQVSGVTTGTTRTLTIPDRSSTIATLAGNQTFTGTNGFTGCTWSGGTIDNATVTVDAVSGHTSASTGTIYGISVTSGTIPAAGIATGAVTYTKLGTDSSYAYTSYTPTTTGITLNNGSVTGNYTQLGKTILFKVKFTMGSTSIITASPTFTLPVAATSFYASNSGIIGSADFVDTGVADYVGGLRLNSTTVVGVLVLGTNGVTTAVSSTVPFTFGTGDQIVAQGIYEAA